MKSLWIVTLILFLASASAVSAETNRTVVLEIEKMTCATCPITVRKAIQRVDGVKSVDVDYESKLATVVFDEDRTTPEAISQASTDVGFPATVREPQ